MPSRASSPLAPASASAGFMNGISSSAPLRHLPGSGASAATWAGRIRTPTWAPPVLSASTINSPMLPSTFRSTGNPSSISSPISTLSPTPSDSPSGIPLAGRLPTPPLPPHNNPPARARLDRRDTCPLPLQTPALRDSAAFRRALLRFFAFFSDICVFLLFFSIYWYPEAEEAGFHRQNYTCLNRNDRRLSCTR